MNELIIQVINNFIIPTAVGVITTTLAAVIPMLVRGVNQWLKNKLKLQQDLINQSHEDWLVSETQKVISYVEEMSRRKVNDMLSTDQPLSSQEKLGMAQQMLTAKTGVDLLKATDLIHSVLFNARKNN